MSPLLLGRKIGMTQVFADDGTVTPVTVIEAGPCVVTQVKKLDKDGYAAVQIGFEESKKLTKALVGHLKASKKQSRHLREMPIESDEQYKVGDTLDLSSFAEVKKVSVAGVSKGKGFAGVIKRHNFSRGPETHGSDHHRKPGSIGGMFPQRVLKGQRLPGHMGAQRVTIAGLDVIHLDKAQNTLTIRGAVPGANGTLLEIRGILS